MKSAAWFEVDKEGLKALQDGKSKSFIIRELVQNAFDENITECRVDLEWSRGFANIGVYDDSPDGFSNLSHAFTLFADTYKRKDPEKRGRFNLGEKQVLAISDGATISTTKGTIVFEKDGRKHLRSTREVGSEIRLRVRMTREEYDEMVSESGLIIPPDNVKLIISGSERPHPTVRAELTAKLQTEILEDEILRRKTRETKVRVYHPIRGEAYLYEMGLPVCKIDCLYSIDVQQKVPLAMDRETVPQRYLEDLYALVLNEVKDDITEENASDKWIRMASSSDNIERDAMKTVLDKRFGEHHVIATPGDRHGIDEATSKGFNVIRGSEMSKDEWEQVKKYDLIQSTAKAFPQTFTGGEPVEADMYMKQMEKFVHDVAMECLGFDIRVKFMGWSSSVAAQYGDRTLTFNVHNLGKEFFQPQNFERFLDLLIHELAHEYGTHTEHGYHDAITRLGAKLIYLALTNPSFFPNHGGNRKLCKNGDLK